MAKGYILFNPLAGKGDCEESARLLEVILPDQVQFYDITRITNYSAFLQSLEEDDYLVIAGGDGTLNRFINASAGIRFPQKILYFPVGTGNDFARDMNKDALCSPFLINEYIQNLPSVEVKGRTCHFLNGVGFGIDGYCCQVGDELKQTPGKKVNYTSIAIGGLLQHFAPRNAIITVDGRKYTYEKVWIAPTMHGRFYGGGMMAAPAQDRRGPELTAVVFHNAGRLRTLSVFPGIFKGTHIKHTDMVTIHTGREITVEFDRPTPLQIDGETIVDVTSYTARSAAWVPQKSKERTAV